MSPITRLLSCAALVASACVASPPASQPPREPAAYTSPDEPPPEDPPPFEPDDPAPDDSDIAREDPAAPEPDATAPTPARVPAGSACLQPDDPKVAAVRAEAAKRTQAAFDAALKRRGLTAHKLGVHHRELHRGIRGARNSPRPHRSGEVVQDTVDGVSGRFVAGTTSWSGSARHPELWAFVADDHGRIFRLQRREHIGPDSVHVVLCGCSQRQCGPYGSGCPACGSTSQVMYGPLPDGTRYAGDIEVAYPIAKVTTAHAKGTCTPVRACPPPPP